MPRCHFFVNVFFYWNGWRERSELVWTLNWGLGWLNHYNSRVCSRDVYGRSLLCAQWTIRLSSQQGCQFIRVCVCGFLCVSEKRVDTERKAPPQHVQCPLFLSFSTLKEMGLSPHAVDLGKTSGPIEAPGKDQWPHWSTWERPVAPSMHL